MAKLNLLSDNEKVVMDIEVLSNTLRGVIRLNTQQQEKIKSEKGLNVPEGIVTTVGSTRELLKTNMRRLLGGFGLNVKEDMIIIGKVTDMRDEKLKNTTYKKDPTIFDNDIKKYDSQSQYTPIMHKTIVTVDVIVDKQGKSRAEVDLTQFGEEGTKTFYAGKPQYIIDRIDIYLQGINKLAYYDVKLGKVTKENIDIDKAIDQLKRDLGGKNTLEIKDKLLIDVTVENDRLTGIVHLPELKGLPNSIAAHGKIRKELLDNIIEQLHTLNLKGKLGWGTYTDQTTSHEYKLDPQVDKIIKDSLNKTEASKKDDEKLKELEKDKAFVSTVIPLIKSKSNPKDIQTEMHNNRTRITVEYPCISKATVKVKLNMKAIYLEVHLYSDEANDPTILSLIDGAGLKKSGTQIYSLTKAKILSEISVADVIDICEKADRLASDIASSANPNKVIKPIAKAKKLAKGKPFGTLTKAIIKGIMVRMKNIVTEASSEKEIDEAILSLYPSLKIQDPGGYADDDINLAYVSDNINFDFNYNQWAKVKGKEVHKYDIENTWLTFYIIGKNGKVNIDARLEAEVYDDYEEANKFVEYPLNLGIDFTLDKEEKPLDDNTKNAVDEPQTKLQMDRDALDRLFQVHGYKIITKNNRAVAEKLLDAYKISFAILDKKVKALITKRDKNSIPVDIQKELKSKGYSITDKKTLADKGYSANNDKALKDVEHEDLRKELPYLDSLLKEEVRYTSHADEIEALGFHILSDNKDRVVASKQEPGHTFTVVCTNNENPIVKLSVSDALSSIDTLAKLNFHQMSDIPSNFMGENIPLADLEDTLNKVKDILAKDTKFSLILSHLELYMKKDNANRVEILKDGSKYPDLTVLADKKEIAVLSLQKYNLGATLLGKLVPKMRAIGLLVKFISAQIDDKEELPKNVREEIPRESDEKPIYTQLNKDEKEELDRIYQGVKKHKDLVDKDEDFQFIYLDTKKEFAKYKATHPALLLMHFGDKSPVELDKNEIFLKFKRGRGLSIVRKWFKTTYNGEKCWACMFYDGKIVKEQRIKLIKESMILNIKGKTYLVESLNNDFVFLKGVSEPIHILDLPIN